MPFVIGDKVNHSRYPPNLGFGMDGSVDPRLQPRARSAVPMSALSIVT